MSLKEASQKQQTPAWFRKSMEFESNLYFLQSIKKKSSLKDRLVGLWVEIRMRQRAWIWQSEVTVGSVVVAGNASTGRNKGEHVDLSTGYRA